MLIGGLQRFTLSDFPGMTAAIVFCQGCNYRCPFCHNQELLSLGQATETLSATTVLQYFLERKGALGGIVFSGGEPTLQDTLLDYIKATKKLGYKIKLDTNGSQPTVIDRLLSLQLVDYIAMDIKAPWNKYSILSGVKVVSADIAESINAIATSGIAHHFRTTWVKSLLNSADMLAIRKMVPIGSNYVVQPFQSTHAMDPSLRSAGREGQVNTNLTGVQSTLP